MLEFSQSNSMQFNRLNIAGNYRQLNFQTIEKATGNQSRNDFTTDKFYTTLKFHTECITII